MIGIHHVGITVSNLDRAIAFYHDVLGLPLVSEPTPVFDAPELGPAVGVPGAALRVVLFGAGDVVVELVEYVRPGSPIDAPLAQNALGAQHVAFCVDDIRQTKHDLEVKGVVFYSDVNVVDEGVLAGWRWVYFSDPDGNALELVEIAYVRQREREAGIRAYLKRRADIVQ